MEWRETNPPFGGIKKASIWFFFKWIFSYYLGILADDMGYN
jgi:hypothetical protein